MGKLPPDALREVLGCIKKSVEVIVPPMPGFDAGAHEIGDNMCMVVATDPCIGVPEEWFGWLLIHYSVSDVAVFGAKPRFCTINLLGPPGTKTAVFKKVMKQACCAAEELEMSIVTGHTGTYEGLSTLVATCTVYGFIPKEELITPAGARPRDYVLCTKPVGLETLVNFSLSRKVLAIKLFGRGTARNLARQVKMQTCVDEALLLARIRGASAMHDATEGGVVAALNEMAEASNVGFSVNYAKIPITPETQKLTKHFRLTLKQAMSMSSTGTLLAAVSPRNKQKVMRALSKRGVDARIIGVFTRDKRRLIRCEGEKTEFPSEADDPYAKIVGT